ncbi:HAMP domain-containing sensor histidine kinase [Sulfuricurvum sp.]|uniref:sensor histidine kinase n=1 Tax=Sulfuricurvum sp. TaxID=2025608 RepID=UPI002E2F1B2E|nr:HAMP domain-containing sensor histidine kinase [Sulfuricurvum sp.]HEX5330938.1 HAMP domain-containing sensor histidine kinase [Sulfuricurvum sp.]
MKTYYHLYADNDTLEQWIQDNFVLENKEIVIQLFSPITDNPILLEVSDYLNVLLPDARVIISASDAEVLLDRINADEIILSLTLFDYQRQMNYQNKLMQMGEMVAMIAHQWRQPLNALSATAINMILKAQMEELQSEDVVKGAFFIQNQCQKMSQTIDTFMEFVKPSKEVQGFSLRHSVDQSLLLIERQLYNHNITIKIHEEIKGVEIFGYEDQFEQVLLNLFSNARDAFDESQQEEKTLIITIMMDEEARLILSVEDNAGGIPESIRDKIFNIFFTHKDKGKGTGLGLYMSLEIIRKSFNSQLHYIPISGGSRFEVIFNPEIISY